MSNIINFGGGATNIPTPFKPEGKSYLTFSSPNSFTLAVNDATKHWDGTLEYFDSDKTWTVWDGTTTLSAVDNDGEYVLYLRGTGNTKITGLNADGPSDTYRWVLTGSDIACVSNIENLLDYATVESGQHPTMAEACYGYMFQGCTGLTKAPALPATTLESNCYRSMFSGCTSLTKAPALPATTLVNYCYYQMFQSCTSLIQAPALPATTLADYCYYQMFEGRTSLTQAPALPATTLAGNCYFYMFFGCTSLTQAPALPATTLTEACYFSMFQNCTALTQAPALPATTLATNCYAGMFQNCTSLTQAPALPATTLKYQCYAYMFRGCTSLTQAPALPATTLADRCYYFMFLNCTSLTQAPALPATMLANYCYNSMFRGCTSLKLSSSKTGEYTQEYRIPSSGTGTTATNALTDMFTSTGGTFTGTPEINTTYYLSSDNIIVHETEIATLREYVESMIDSPFKPEGKSYLTFSSPNSFTLKVNDTTKHWDGTLEYFASNNTWTAWDGTTTLSAVDNDGEYVLYLRGTGNTKIGYYDGNNYIPWTISGTDVRCNGNIEILLDYATVEAGQHPTMAEQDCFGGLFMDCTALTKAPDLPATTLANYCYTQMFYGCTSLTQAPALPATTLANHCYDTMFYGCFSLTKAPALPATTLASSCYAYMFQDCASLTQAPDLPATTLAEGCYSRMFNGCTSLTQAPALPTTTLASSCYAFMFSGCISLKLSSTQTGEYIQEYRIPTTGAGTTATDALIGMFNSTGGTFTGTPSINTTYYLSTDNMIVRDTEIATLNGYVGSMIDVKAEGKQAKITASGILKGDGAGDVTTATKGTDYAGISETVTATLLAANWTGDVAPYTYTLAVTGVTANSNQELLPSLTITEEQLTALQAANIQDGGQAVNSVTLTAFGDKPTIDLPIRVIVRGDS